MLEDERKEYQEGFLSERELLQNPFAQGKKWIEDALHSSELEPTAACLATSTKTGRASSRMVLLKHFDEDGAYFFTHKTSKKGMQLEENPYASLTLYWKTLERELIFEGPVIALPEKLTEEYFSKRPRKSQLGALASKQGEVIEGKRGLIDRFEELERKYAGRAIPMPETWRGYAILPNLIEFWQGRPSRLHDHFAYRKSPSGWLLERISP